MKTEFVQSAVEMQRLSFNVEQKSTQFLRLFARIVLGAIIFVLFCGFDSQTNAIANDSTDSSSNDNYEELYIPEIDDISEEDNEEDNKEGNEEESAPGVPSSALHLSSSAEAESDTDESNFEYTPRFPSGLLHQFDLDSLRDFSSNPFWISAVCISAVIVLGIAFPLLHRMFSGASPYYLLRTRFYEIPSLRILFHILKFFCYACIIEGVILTLVLVYQMYCKNWDEAFWIPIATILVVTIVLYAINKMIIIPLVTLPDPIPPCYDSVRNITHSDQVSRWYLNCLGEESFPEMLIYGKRMGLLVRRALLFVLATPFILFVIGLIIKVTEVDKNWEWANAFCEYAGMLFISFVDYIMDLMSNLPEISPVIIVPAFVCLSFAFLYLINTDNSYLIIRFPVKLILLFLLAAGLFCCFCMVYQDPTPRLILLGVLDVLFIYRFSCDLSWASRYLREHRTKLPIAENFDQIFPQAAEIKQRQDCELPELNMDEIALRIQQGLHNVEKYSFLAVRNMIRFIRIIHVEQERFAAVRIRFMTVRRYLTRRRRGGTYGFGALEPVPIWNEDKFPLDVPNGYVNHETTDWLGSEWDVVESCSRCYGTGRTTRTEYYTDYEYSSLEGRSHSVQKSRTVEEMCSECGGSGRIAYQQGIVTQWQRVIITSSEPATSMTDYFADAEDKTYYSVSLIENREKQYEQPQCDSQIGSDLVNSLEESTERLEETQLDNYVSAVEKLHDGIMYRSDVQAVGFWTLRIIFRRFWGKFGWFFGRTSEFYFRTIPLSLQSLFAVAVTLPLFIAIAVAVFALMSMVTIDYLF